MKTTTTLSEQDRLLMLLKGPDHYAHQAGEEMLSVLNAGKRKRYVAMFKTADRHFEMIMKMFCAEDILRIVKTWLSHYKLPFDPNRLKTFDAFHSIYGKLIADNPSMIRSY